MNVTQVALKSIHSACSLPGCAWVSRAWPGGKYLRVHTSAASVAVFPEPDDVEVQIRDEHIEIDKLYKGTEGYAVVVASLMAS